MRTDSVPPACLRVAQAVRARVPLVVAVLLSVNGCSRDTAALDNFSWAYTAFLNQERDTNGASLVPVVFDQRKGALHEHYGGDAYWIALHDALDDRASRTSRLKQAQEALNADHATIAGMMDAFSTEIDRLDGTVLRLVETANSIRDGDARSDAMSVSRQARDVQARFAALRELLADAFEKRRRVLERVVEDGGNVQMSSLLQRDGATITTDAKQAEECRDAIRTGMAALKDAFSALKGKTGLQAFPSKWVADGAAN